MARSESFTEELAAELRAETPGDAVAVQVDVTDPEAVQAGVETVHEAFETVDVYVHNTPVPNWSGPLDDDPASQTTFDTVGYGFVLVVDELLPDLLDGGGTVILNTGDFVKCVARKMVEQLAPEGVHVVHVFVDGWVDDETVDEGVPEKSVPTLTRSPQSPSDSSNRIKTCGRSTSTSGRGATTRSGRGGGTVGIRG